MKNHHHGEILTVGMTENAETVVEMSAEMIALATSGTMMTMKTITTSKKGVDKTQTAEMMIIIVHEKIAAKSEVMDEMSEVRSVKADEMIEVPGARVVEMIEVPGAKFDETMEARRSKVDETIEARSVEIEEMIEVPSASVKKTIEVPSARLDETIEVHGATMNVKTGSVSIVIEVEIEIAVRNAIVIFPERRGVAKTQIGKVTGNRKMEKSVRKGNFT